MDIKSTPLILTRAISPLEIQEGFNLRYEVFVKEKNFEPDNGTNIEQDHYDKRAHHYVFRDKSTARPIGYFRLLTRPSQHIQESKWLPGSDLWHVNSDMGELSRLLLIKPYRNMATLHTMFVLIEQLFAELDIDFSYAVMENKLARALIKFGYPLSRLSETFELNGQRSTYLLAQKSMMKIKRTA